MVCAIPKCLAKNMHDFNEKNDDNEKLKIKEEY